MADSERMFPILNDPIIKAIPWSAIAPHEAQALANHRQDLKRLAERSGLCVVEAVLVMLGKPIFFSKISAFQLAEYRRILMQLILDFERSRVSLATPSPETKTEGGAEVTEKPELRYVYYDAQKDVWCVEGFWHHPQHRDYHKDWDGDYVILQAYGNFKNELKFVPLAGFSAAYSLAWEPLKVCQFCGFSRMSPCKKRQPCPNLSDYRREPDDPRDPETNAEGSTDD